MRPNERFGHLTEKINNKALTIATQLPNENLVVHAQS